MVEPEWVKWEAVDWSTKLTRHEKKWAYRYLVHRDGEMCGMCCMFPSETGKPRKLDINYIDKDPANGRTTNLKLLCRSCGVKWRHSRLWGPPSPVKREIGGVKNGYADRSAIYEDELPNVFVRKLGAKLKGRNKIESLLPFFTRAAGSHFQLSRLSLPASTVKTTPTSLK